MTDDMTPEQRRRNMQHIRSIDSTPEVFVRKLLFHAGYRYRKNDKRIEGKPDIYLPKYQTVIFINGCYWHRHQNCRKRLSVPATNEDYWVKKFERNIRRDNEVRESLQTKYKMIVIWECAVREYKKNPVALLDLLRGIIENGEIGYYEIN